MPKPKPKGGLLSRLTTPPQVDPREAGWKTLDELLAEDPMSKTGARELLNAAIQRGEIEVKKLPSPYRGKLRKLLNYREIKS